VKIENNIAAFLLTFAPVSRFRTVTRLHETDSMFEGLQKKWKVGGLQLFLILCTFAIGGSATGFVAKKVMNAIAIRQDWLWAIIYILLVTLIWPMMVLLVSIPFGQFRFFSGYIKKLGAKMGIGRKSGLGSSESGEKSPTDQ
jgi:hypothetical protein